MYDFRRNLWWVFAARTVEEKERWMEAFAVERKQVEHDRDHGICVEPEDKKLAMLAARRARDKPKRPKSAFGRIQC